MLDFCVGFLCWIFVLDFVLDFCVGKCAGTPKYITTIVPDLLATHALSGCDTVPTYFGIGKGTVLKILNAAPDSLTMLGSLDAPLPEVVHQSTKFIASCYSRIAGNDMSEIRYKVWAAKL